ncbi:MAG: type II secretion system secretin GspD [Gammaproteobacteria bacterium]|nr:type II secretion system secretin GspD [Gammaproteobacteria bacterium]
MRKIVELAVLACAMALASCTTMEQTSPVPGIEESAAAVLAAESAAPDPQLVEPLQAGAAATVSQEEDLSSIEKGEPTIYRGTGEVYRAPDAINPIRLYGDAVSLNFEQAPLTEVVHAILGDILELDYIVEHPINGQVTLRTRTPIERDQLLDVLESLLKANNALMIRDNDGRLFVSASGQMKKLKPSMISSTDGAAGYSTLIVPLQYISAGNMAEILTPVAEEGAFLRVDNMRNLLMLSGTQSQLQGWQEMIETFDVDILKGMSVGIFPIENAPLEDIDSALSAMLGKDGADNTAESLSGVGSVIRIIPVHRLNSLMVVTPRAHYLDRVRTWIDRLDIKPDANFEPQLYVYPVQNTSASHLAGLLSTIFGGSGGGGSSTAGGTGVAPGLTPEAVSSGGDMGIAGSGVGSSSPKGGMKAKSVKVGAVGIVADEQNNALLIYATGKEYQKIKPAIERLDIAATQVIIEASIIEVTLNDSLRYGLEWTFNSNLGNDYRGTALWDGNSGTGIASQIPGFSYSVVNSMGDIQAVLNALAQEDLVNIISSPSVMVLDNQTATIEVGDRVPVQTSFESLDNDRTIASIEYVDTGVRLQVVPSVNAGGMVTMKIDQSVTDAITNEGITQPTFLERSITSQVAVRSTESVVLGGLIRENKSSGSSGLPILHNIPVIGPLFGVKSQSGSRTELLVVITPRVIYSDADLRAVSKEMRRQMRGLDLIDLSESSSFLGERESADPSPEQ